MVLTRPVLFLSFLSLSLLLLLSLNLSVRASEKKDGSAAKGFVLKVTYDRASGRLSLRASSAPLGEVTAEITRKTSVPISVLKPEILKDRISVDLEGVKLEAGLRKAFEGYGCLRHGKCKRFQRGRKLLLNSPHSQSFLRVSTMFSIFQPSSVRTSWMALTPQ